MTYYVRQKGEKFQVGHYSPGVLWIRDAERDTRPEADQAAHALQAEWDTPEPDPFATEQD